MTVAVVCLAPSAAELIGQARTLAAGVRVVALCEATDEQLELYGACGADEILRMPSSEDDCAQGTRLAHALELLAPDAALFPATVRGRFLAAWVAAKLQTGLTADCTALSLTAEGQLLQTRPAYGGNLIADIVCPNHRPQLASVRPGVFATPERDNTRACPTLTEVADDGFAWEGFNAGVKGNTLAAKLTRLAFTPAAGGVALQTAEVIVAGGKGVQGKRGFETLWQLAVLLNGALGATRGAVDAGWAPYACQIGQTGVTVRPRLYLAFGISGMVQHLVGMGGAQTVIAVNNDRNAPIFDHADYGIVGDWQTTAETMIHYLRERMDTP